MQSEGVNCRARVGDCAGAGENRERSEQRGDRARGGQSVQGVIEILK